jgi:hypothetical protein
MISPYSSIVSYQNDDWEEYFDRIAMIEIFKPVIDAYKTDRVRLRCVIQYILHCYSVDSEKVKLGIDWHINKKEIYEDTCIPMKDIYEQTVLLKSEAVLETINRWLAYQDSEIHAEMAMAKDLKMEMQLTANSPIRKSSGEIDFDQKMRNATYVTELRKKIKDLESEYIQNNIKLKDAVKEFKGARKNKSTLSAVNAFQ